MKYKVGTLVLADEQEGAVIGYIRQVEHYKDDITYLIEWVDGRCCDEPYKESHVEEFLEILENYYGVNR